MSNLLTCSSLDMEYGISFMSTYSPNVLATLSFIMLMTAAPSIMYAVTLRHETLF